MPCEINNNSDFDITEIEDLIQDLFDFSRKRFGFNKPPVLNLVTDKNNTSPLGKTAHYDPNNMSITIYVDGRHPKDIMRSFSHELVHHNQNLKGEFANIVGQGGSNYAQTNPHLRKMEKEAYLKGNMCFRDWEDGYKSSNPNILNERRIYKMSTKKWKNRELNTLLNEKWGFSMDLSKLNENKMPMKDEPEGKDLNKDGKKGHGKVPAFLEEEEIEEDLNKLKGGLKDYMKNKANQGEKKDSDKKEDLDEMDMGVKGGLGKTPKSETDAAKKQSDKNYAYMKKDKEEKKTTIMKEEDKEMGDNPEGVAELMSAINKLSEKESEQVYKMLLSKHGKEDKKDSEADMKESKLRGAVRKIIKSKLKSK